MAHLFAALDPEAYDRTYSDDEIVSRLIGMLRRRFGRTALVVATSIGAAASGAAIPLFLSRAVGTLTSDASPLPQVGWLAAVGLLAWVMNFASQSASASVVQATMQELRMKTFRSVIDKDLAFFDRYPTGSLVSRVVTDTQSFANVLQLSIDVMTQSLLVFIMAMMLLVIYPPLGALVLLLGSAIVAVTAAFRRISRTAARSESRAVAQVNAFVQETIEGIAVARNFRQQKATAKQLDDVNRVWYREALRLNRLFSGIIPFLITLTGFGTAAVVWSGGYRIARGQLGIGPWFLFLESLALFWFPLTSIASFRNQFQQGVAAGERIFSLQDAPKTVRQNRTEPVGPLGADIEFDGVTFGYDPDASVLVDFNLKIPARSTIALVGHTGAGKSTIMRLIARSYEFQAGRIRIDGRDIRDLDLDQYRCRLGILPQRPFLVTGTVRANIALGRPSALDCDETELHEAVESAAMSIADGGWVAGLEHGLDTQVGEGGRNLSMGQRQLVGLARVLYQNPDILLMDEATSSIDPITDAQVQAGLRVASRGRTTVVIAHRLPTVLHADSIAVIGDGRVLEQGSHPELLGRDGLYTSLYHEYFGFQAVPMEMAR